MPNAQLEALYKELPKIKCRGKCQAFCGPVAGGAVELQAIRQQVGERVQTMPYGDGRELITNTVDLTCPMLERGKCAVYAQRPMICRVWGMTKALRCPHGCRPTRWLSDTEARSLIARAAAVGLITPCLSLKTSA